MRKPTLNEHQNHVSVGLVCRRKSKGNKPNIVVLECHEGRVKVRSFDLEKNIPVGTISYSSFETFWDRYERLYVRLPNINDVLKRTGLGYSGRHQYVKVENISEMPGGKIYLAIVSCELGKGNSTKGGRRSYMLFNEHTFYEKFFILDIKEERIKGIKK